MPSSALKVLNIFSIKENDINFNSIKNNNYLKPNQNINKIDILFQKIENND